MPRCDRDAIAMRCCIPQCAGSWATTLFFGECRLLCAFGYSSRLWRMLVERLSGCVAIVTGAASGIGEATARLFAEEGARVLIADIQEERGREVAKEIGDDARFVPCDVTDESAVAAAVDAAVSEWGQLDCMFNNAG